MTAGVCSKLCEDRRVPLHTSTSKSEARNEEDSNKPIWGVAKSLPRVVRPGMRRSETGKKRNEKNERTTVETEDPGQSAAIPQVNKIPDQQEDEEEHNNKQETSSMKSSRFSDLRSRGKKKCVEEEEEEEGTSAQVETDGRTRQMSDETLQDQEVSKSKHPKYFSQGSPRGGHESHLDEKLQYAADNDDMDEYEAEERKHDFNRWSAIRRKFKAPLAECLGTMVAFTIGLSANLSVLTSVNSAGNYQSKNWAWGLGITLGIYISGGISGAHLNPAVSILLAVFRGFPPRQACIFICAQIIGAFLAGLIAFAIYHHPLLHYSETSSLDASETGSAFWLAPTKFEEGGGIGVGTGFLVEFIASAILGIAILALGDDSNAPPGAGMHALIVGLIVVALTMAFGYIDGCGMNPARDIGPRMAAAAVGYGKHAFLGDKFFWIWGVWGGEISGICCGGLLYDVAIFVGGESPVNFPVKKWKRIGNEMAEDSGIRKLEEGMQKLGEGM